MASKKGTNVVEKEDFLRATCFLKGQTPRQDAQFILLPDNTVRVVVQDGRVGCRDDIFSVRAAYTLRKSLLQKGWQLIPQPRRTQKQLRMGIQAARRSFLQQPFRIRREVDPDANLVPPERQLQRQRERITHEFELATSITRILPGGAIETNKRRH